jgi:hypothetical protein
MTPASPNQPTPYQNFEALTRRILTTPKAELEKNAPKAKPHATKPAKPRGGK